MISEREHREWLYAWARQEHTCRHCGHCDHPRAFRDRCPQCGGELP